MEQALTIKFTLRLEWEEPRIIVISKDDPIFEVNLKDALKKILIC